jgi:hypothetical protein
MVRRGDPRMWSRISRVSVMTRVMDLMETDVIFHHNELMVVHGIEMLPRGIRLVYLRPLKGKVVKEFLIHGRKELPLVHRNPEPESVMNFPDPFRITHVHLR